MGFIQNPSAFENAAHERIPHIEAFLDPLRCPHQHVDREGRMHREPGGNVKRTSGERREPVDREHVDRAAEALLEARRSCGLAGDPSDIPSLRDTLYARALEISASAGGKKVEFLVSVEEGKPKVKAVLR